MYQVSYVSVIQVIFNCIPGESIKPPAFEKNLLEYQSNDIENSLVLSPIFQIRFRTLAGFNQSCLPVEKGDFLQ